MRRRSIARGLAAGAGSPPGSAVRVSFERCKTFAKAFRWEAASTRWRRAVPATPRRSTATSRIWRRTTTAPARRAAATLPPGTRATPRSGAGTSPALRQAAASPPGSSWMSPSTRSGLSATAATIAPRSSTPTQTPKPARAAASNASSTRTTTASRIAARTPPVTSRASSIDSTAGALQRGQVADLFDPAGVGGHEHRADHRYAEGAATAPAGAACSRARRLLLRRRLGRRGRQGLGRRCLRRRGLGLFTTRCGRSGGLRGGLLRRLLLPLLPLAAGGRRLLAVVAVASLLAAEEGR